MTSTAHRWVADTNIIVSRLLLPSSKTATALDCALKLGDLLVSDETMEELAEVLSRPKFEKYISLKERLEFFSYLSRVAIHIGDIQKIQICRDPKDDKFLGLALSGAADAIITGDKDLLDLHPFMDVPILTPDQFIAKFSYD